MYQDIMTVYSKYVFNLSKHKHSILFCINLWSLFTTDDHKWNTCGTVLSWMYNCYSKLPWHLYKPNP